VDVPFFPSESNQKDTMATASNFERANDAILHYQFGTDLAKQGRLAEAVLSFQRALELNPNLDAAQNDLGAAFLQQGQTEEAIASFRRAIRIDPNRAHFYSNLGHCLLGIGQITEAQTCLKEALRLNPNIAPVHNNLGNAFSAQKRFAEAEQCYRQALLLNPNYPDAHYNLANVLVERGEISEATDCYHHALRLNPSYAAAYNNLGKLLASQGKLDDAEQYIREALRINPNFADAYVNLGNLMVQQGHDEQAIECFRWALQLIPNNAVALSNLGICLKNEGRLADAEACFRQALTVDPSNADAHNNLGNLLWEFGRFSETEKCYRSALRHKPDGDIAHTNLGMLKLLQGDFHAGWPLYEWRLRSKNFPFPLYPLPFWDGASLVGKTIVLHAEQGLGDTIQFIRYARLVKQFGATVFLACPAELVKILRSCPGIDQIFTTGSRLPPCDFQAMLLSLPGIMTTTLTTIPTSVPYVIPDRELINHWRRELGHEKEFKIGIVWQGNPRISQPGCRAADKRRSFALEHFEPLSHLPDVQLLSLQKGFGTEQLVRRKSQWEILPLGDKLGDFNDTAAVMMNLDLIISADTAPLHLAGALTRNVWAVLPYAGCWRWLLDRPNSPWYPTMRLFRQSKPGDWAEVFERISGEVQKLTTVASTNG
jgi:Flp pilus assembly protein TadD